MATSMYSGASAAQHGQWSGAWVFVLAAGGAAIGLNNIWQFPYYAAQYGGGAFLLVYVLFLAVIGLPLLMSQILIGRMGQAAPIHTVEALVAANGSSRFWLLLGWLSTLTGFFVLSYLSVIAGWALAYALRAGAGVLQGLTADGINSLFTAFVGDAEKQVLWHSAFMVITMVVVARGLRHGLEPVVKFMMPALFLVLAAILAYAATIDFLTPALGQLFAVDFSRLSAEGVLVALGHSFFSLALGFGVMMIYGTYLSDEVGILGVSLWVVVLDLLAALLASVVVFAVLAGGREPLAHGPLLIFQALPLALDVLPVGTPITLLFFLLIAMAAWLTAIALIEPAVAWVVEHWGVSRLKAAVICGLAAWLLGLVIVLSFNHWKFSFSYFGGEKTLGVFDLLQVLTSNLLLPLVGVLTALFAGWVLDRTLSEGVLGLRRPVFFQVWLWLIRIVVPLLILVFLISIPRLFL